MVSKLSLLSSLLNVSVVNLCSTLADGGVVDFIYFLSSRSGPKFNMLLRLQVTSASSSGRSRGRRGESPTRRSMAGPDGAKAPGVM